MNWPAFVAYFAGMTCGIILGVTWCSYIAGRDLKRK